MTTCDRTAAAAGCAPLESVAIGGSPTGVAAGAAIDMVSVATETTGKVRVADGATCNGTDASSCGSVDTTVPSPKPTGTTGNRRPLASVIDGATGAAVDPRMEFTTSRRAFLRSLS